MARPERDRERIVDRLRRELDARPEILLAVLHGSFLRGGAYRDIDVAVWLDPDRLSRDQRFRHALDLSVQLEIQLGCAVDVRALNDASLAFRYHALRGDPLVVRDEDWLDDLRARTWDDYLERYLASVGRLPESRRLSVGSPTRRPAPAPRPRPGPPPSPRRTEGSAFPTGARRWRT